MNIVDKYLQLINRTYYGLSVVYPETIQQKFRPPFLIDLIETIQYRMEMNNYYWMEIISIVVCIILLAIIRYVLVNKFIIKQLRHYRLILGHHDHHRFGNNLWNCLFYMHTFTLSWWIMANIGCLEYPKRFWINNSSDIYYGGQTSMIIMYLYLIDISNYIYSMIYLCKNYRQQLWDKDSPMIIIHHLAAILLFTLSHMINMHRMGVAIIFLLEISEIFYFLRCMVKLQIHFIQRWQNSIRFIGLLIFFKSNLFHYVNDYSLLVYFLYFSSGSIMFSYATGTSSSSSSSANNRNNNNNNSSSRENCRNSTNQNNSSNPRGQSFKFNFNESFRKIYDDFQDIKVSFDDISS